jgi:hypothetical protein
MATIVVIDENEIVVESWIANTEASTSWSDTVTQTGEDQS